MAQDATTRNETTGNRHQPAWHNLISTNTRKGRAPTQAAALWQRSKQGRPIKQPQP